ncbi:MAG: tryptophan synthase subunit alpha [Planctomycetota bacterium]|jgi:tryptophan synthase alpha chain
MSESFAKLKRSGRKALVPFLTAGYPSKRRSLDLLCAVADAGADAIEIGIPFSDPLADGPVIQTSSQKALENGTTIGDALGIARKFRRRYDTPLLFMTYANPIARMGIGKFFGRCRKEGLAGVIVPDLPPEESAPYEGHGVPLVYLCSPTCAKERVGRIVRRSRPFVYLVSLKGVTGASDRLPRDLGAFVRRVRRHTKRPLYIGFGISTPRHARLMGGVADGVIVGSAILKRVQKGAGPRAVAKYVSSLRKALDRS